MSVLDLKVFSKCVTEEDDGVLLNIEVKPGSKTAGIEGIDEWRRSIEVRIKARAEKGKANKELIKLLSSLLSLPSSSFIIVKGEKSRLKIINILGLNKEELRLRLNNGINKNQPML